MLRVSFKIHRTKNKMFKKQFSAGCKEKMHKKFAAEKESVLSRTPIAAICMPRKNFQ
jgi:hypothetical protein